MKDNMTGKQKEKKIRKVDNDQFAHANSSFNRS